MSKHQRKRPTKALAKQAIRKQVAATVAKAVATKKKASKPGIARSLVKGAGRLLGGMIGFGDAGEQAGDAFAKFLGMGAYRVNSNSIMTNSQQAPVFDNSDKSITISHSELVTDVAGSVLFNSQVFMIDPTSEATFPYLSGIAQNFEQYEFQGLVFTYKPTSGSAIASTNNALGSVILTTDYDVSRPLFASKPEMEAFEFSTSCEPSSLMYHPVECNPKRDVVNRRYATGPNRLQRSSTLFTGVNSLNIANNLQFLGRTQLATVGMQAVATVGELWVSYKIKLSIPKKPSQSSAQGTFHLSGNGNTLPIGSSTAYGSNYIVSAESSSSLAVMGVTVVGTETRVSTYGLPPGMRLNVTVSADAGAGTVTIQPTTSNGAVTGSFYLFPTTSANAGIFNFSTPGGQARMTYNTTYLLTANSYTDTTSYIAFPAPTVGTAPAAWDIVISIIPAPTTSSIAILAAAEVESEMQDKISYLADRLAQLESSPQLITFQEEKDQGKPEVQQTPRPVFNFMRR